MSAKKVHPYILGTKPIYVRHADATSTVTPESTDILEKAIVGLHCARSVTIPQLGLGRIPTWFERLRDVSGRYEYPYIAPFSSTNDSTESTIDTLQGLHGGRRSFAVDGKKELQKNAVATISNLQHEQNQIKHMRPGFAMFHHARYARIYLLGLRPHVFV